VLAWQTRAEWPLALLAVAFLLAYTVQVLGHRLDPALRHTVNELLWFIWGLFAVEFGIRVFPARRHMRNVVRHSADVAMIALSMLRPLRILRVLILVRMLNGAWPIRCAAAWS
jgi:voltage-gated potassium channel